MGGSTTLLLQAARYSHSISLTLADLFSGGPLSLSFGMEGEGCCSCRWGSLVKESKDVVVRTEEEEGA